MSKMSRLFSCTSYIDFDFLFNYFKSNSSITNFLMILHNKDNCEPHTHFLVRYRNARSLNAVKNEFRWLDAQNTYCEFLTDKISMFHYLTHEDEDKAKYSVKDMVSDDFSFWTNQDLEASAPTCLDLIDCLNSKVPFRKMVERFGRDFVLNYEKYSFIASKIKEEEFTSEFSQKDVCAKQLFIEDP